MAQVLKGRQLDANHLAVAYPIGRGVRAEIQHDGQVFTLLGVRWVGSRGGMREVFGLSTFFPGNYALYGRLS